MGTRNDFGSGDTGAKVRPFTLAEANAAVPKLIPLTESAILRLNEAEGRWRTREADLDPVTVERAEREELGMIYADWAQRVSALGALPKGAFTVDFPSAHDDEVLWCWSYGEHAIGHTHKTWENFSHRVPFDSDGDEAEEEGESDA